ncbi:MAG: ATP-binding protein [Planctomycetaceae bacterium]|jgi:predicted ATP-dependent endonuclease of OLD family|nr:ATP-binding protein [Planctomycetaceae bacterium]
MNTREFFIKLRSLIDSCSLENYMFLEIKNIGKIKNAKIELRGITVLAGNNNTGKSTFGKVLFCVFNSFFDAENTIQKERHNDIESIISRFIPLQYRDRKSVKNITEKLLSEKDIENKDVTQYFLDEIPDLQVENSTLEPLLKRIEQSKNVSDEEIQKRIISHWFSGEFNNPITHINQPNVQGEILLIIRKKMIKVIVNAGECVEFSDEVRIQHNAFYIDTPFLFDDIVQASHLSYINHYQHWDHLRKKLRYSTRPGNMVEEVVLKKKIDSVMQLLYSTVNGNFKEVKQDLGFQESGLNKPLHISKMSTGMKVFLIVKRLLESGNIKEQDVLIFDEPEIHLHPEWQIVFAEMLVLLQRDFNLTILLTTHSPYFLNAIETFSKRHEVVNNCNYYFTTNEDGFCSIQDVTKDTSIIYDIMTKPFQQLENLRYE